MDDKINNQQYLFSNAMLTLNDDIRELEMLFLNKEQREDHYVDPPANLTFRMERVIASNHYSISRTLPKKLHINLPNKHKCVKEYKGELKFTYAIDVTRGKDHIIDHEGKLIHSDDENKVDAFEDYNSFLESIKPKDFDKEAIYKKLNSQFDHPLLELGLLDENEYTMDEDIVDQELSQQLIDIHSYIITRFLIDEYKDHIQRIEFYTHKNTYSVAYKTINKITIVCEDYDIFIDIGRRRVLNNNFGLQETNRFTKRNLLFSICNKKNRSYYRLSNVSFEGILHNLTINFFDDVL